MLEIIVYNRITNYINKHNILFDNQYGFTKNHSISLAFLHLYEKIASAIDRKEFKTGIFLYLSKRLIPLTMTFRLINLNIMVNDDSLLIGWKPTSVIDCNTFNIMIPIPCLNVFSVECLKVQFLVHSCFCYILMISVMFQIFSIWFCFLMTIMYFILIKTNPIIQSNAQLTNCLSSLRQISCQ